MTTPEYESLLPKVEEADLLDIVFEDVIDTGHRKRWERFARTNPILAREVLKKAYASAQMEYSGSLDRQKAIIDMLTFAISALEFAAKREKDDRTPQTPRARTGDGGEVRPPLA